MGLLEDASAEAAVAGCCCSAFREPSEQDLCCSVSPLYSSAVMLCLHRGVAVYVFLSVVRILCSRQCCLREGPLSPERGELREWLLQVA